MRLYIVTSIENHELRVLGVCATKAQARKATAMRAEKQEPAVVHKASVNLVRFLLGKMRGES